MIKRVLNELCALNITPVLGVPDKILSIGANLSLLGCLYICLHFLSDLVKD